MISRHWKSFEQSLITSTKQLKNHPKMALVIGKFRNASSSSSKRTAQWLYEKMVEVVEIHQLEENTQSVDKNLSQIQRLMLHQTSQTNQGTKPQKVIRIPSHRNLQSLTSLTNLRSLTNLTDKRAKEVDAAAAKGKGKKGDKGKGDKGKGDKGQSPSPRLTPEEMMKKPCMYFGFNACSKGDQCPYLHDPNNKYSGPKPKGLAKKEEASSSAGAAQVIAGAAFASSIKGAKVQTSSEDSAIKGAVRNAKKWFARFVKDQKRFPKVGVFEKVFEAIAALVARCNPLSVEQEGSAPFLGRLATMFQV